MQIHATCVSIEGKGVLLLGPSGSGKSDLALRLIDGGAMLVADDRVDVMKIPLPIGGRPGGGQSCPVDESLTSEQASPHPNPPPAEEGILIASAPQNLRGMLEARGVGILRLLYVEQAPLALAIELVARDKVERLPEAQFRDCLGLQLPLLLLHAFDNSVCAKIRAYVRNKL